MAQSPLDRVNSTGVASSLNWTVKDLVVLSAYSVVFIVSVFSNGLVVMTVVTCRRMRSVTNYFIVSLASADLLLIIGIPFTLIASWFCYRWPFGDVLCPVITYLQAVAVFLSTFTLVGLSVDRFRSVVYPLRPRVTSRQAAIAIACFWLLAGAVPLPVAVVSRVNSTTGNCEEQWPSGAWKSAFTMSLLILQYFLPLAVLAVTYATICYVIWIKKDPGLTVMRITGRVKKVALSKRKVVIVMITVVVVYALCWLPLHVITLLGDLNPSIWNYEQIQTVWISCHWLAMSSSCWNPIIYCWKNDAFRVGFLYALVGRCPCRCSLGQRACELYERRQPTTAFSSSTKGNHQSSRVATILAIGTNASSPRRSAQSLRVIQANHHEEAGQSPPGVAFVESATNPVDCVARVSKTRVTEALSLRF